VLNAALSAAVYGAFYGALWYPLHGHVNPVAIEEAPAVAVAAPVNAATLQQET
jgi:hypothetical protein